MLTRAREKAGDLPNLEFVLGRMEEFEFEQRFGLIFICYSSFTCLKSVEAQERALHNIRSHLKKGGRVIIDIFVPNEELLGKPLTDHQTREWKLARELQDPNGGPRHQVWERAYHVPNEQLFELESMIKTLDSMGKVVGTPQYFQMPGRYFHRFELHYLLRLCVFEIVNLYGCFYLEPFNRPIKRMNCFATPSTDYS